MRIYALALLLTVPALLAGLPARCEESLLLDFGLEDQFGETHQRSDVLGNVVLLIGSDKNGSQFNEAWGKAIHGALGGHPGYDQISHLAYADLRGVPFFIKGLVRGKFPDDPDRWVLMDWKGIFAKAYDFVPDSSNVLIFASDGALVFQTSGRAPDDQALESLVSALRDLLDEVR